MTSQAVQSTVSSDEINYLVFRYLQESGYVHSAFTFGYESQVVKSKIDGSQIPPGALLSFVQRGVNFVEIEETLDDNKPPGHSTSALDGVTSLLDVHRCLCSQDFKAAQQEKMANSGNGNAGPIEMDIDDKETRDSGEKSAGAQKANSLDVHESDALMLKGHSSEVFVCAWNPKTSLLATGSGDSTARIWPIPASLPAQSSAAAAQASQPLVLQHSLDKYGNSLQQRRKSNDVTTLDWNPSGTMLATGSYDGCARVWSDTGELKHTFVMHKGPLFSIKWNNKGNYIVSGSVDHTTSVWNAETGRCVKHFTFHDAPTLDVDWKDDETFASCSTDKMIYLCSLESNLPVQTFEGHEDEINCLKFDPSGNLLASCADDFSAKIWSTKTSKVIYNLREHTREVYTLQWCPSVYRRLVLASASFDAMVKLWDVNSGRCIKTLAGHTDPVYSLAYSPNGQYLASGSFDRCLNIWNAKDGTLLKRFRGDGGIFEVAWNPGGDKVSAVFSSNTVAVIDLRKMQATTVRL